MQNQKVNTEQFYRTLVAIWFALFISQFFFLFILYYVKPEFYSFDFSQPLLGKNAPIVLIFAFVALMNIAISFFLRKDISANRSPNKMFTLFKPR